MGWRMSPRLRKIPGDKRPFYGPFSLRSCEKKTKQSPDTNGNGNGNADSDSDSDSDHRLPPEEKLYKWLLPSSPLIHKHGISAVRGVIDGLRRSNLINIRSLTGSPQPYSPTLQPILGPIPGIEVGFQFFSRAEIVALGMHARWLSSIDYVSRSRRKKQVDILDTGYSFPLAVAIVLSGQHEEDDHQDVDNSQDIVYTGEPPQDNTSQIQDQVMSFGNLALKNSIKHSTPIRLIRGHKCATIRVMSYILMVNLILFSGNSLLFSGNC